MRGFRLQASGFKLQASSFKLQASSFKELDADRQARVLLSLTAMRAYGKLTAFQKADGLLVDVYQWTGHLPHKENYVLRSQIRRSAISVPANIVEGSARTTHREYGNHLNIALGSAAELRYLLELAGRIYPSCVKTGSQLPARAGEVVGILVGRIDALKTRGRSKPLKPEA